MLTCDVFWFLRQDPFSRFFSIDEALVKGIFLANWEAELLMTGVAQRPHWKSGIALLNEVMIVSVVVLIAFILKISLNFCCF